MVNTMRLLPICSAFLLIGTAACTDRPDPLVPGEEPEVPPTAPTPVGVYEIAVTGLGTGEMSSQFNAIAPSTPGINATLNNAGTGLVFEQVASSSFTEGNRGEGGQRYISFTYRVRNGTGVPLDNLTILLVERAGTVPGTALSSLRRFDGTAASSSIAPQVVPTGSVAIGSDLTTMHALYPDVLQVLSEAEVAAISPPAGVTNIFPVGYVVRNRNTNANRTLPVPSSSNPHQYDGVLTLAFRLPLQATSAQDVFSFFFQILAVTDTEVRLTESMEEAQDTAAVRRLRERATAMGATTVTVLNGSGRMDPADADYPGQRQFCSVRVAGTAATPITYINAPAGYTQVRLYRPGETRSSCDPWFRSGTPGRPATNVYFNMSAMAMDRYGNLMTTAVDSIKLQRLSGPPTTMWPTAGNVVTGGIAAVAVRYSDYGTSELMAVGRRMRGPQQLHVAGVTRTWTAEAGTSDWHTGGNWALGAVPMSLDSVFIPAAPTGGAIFPQLAANVSILGVNVENGATIGLAAFNLTAGGDVATGTSGGITNTVGSLILTGTAKTVQGVLPRVRVLGTYSLTGNVTARAPLRVESGRLRNASFRVRAISQ
jgi:hypothetical protein